MRARRAENPARMHGRGGNAWRPVSAGGSAPLATVVSLPTARAARPGAQRRGTPTQGVQSLVFAESAEARLLLVLLRRRRDESLEADLVPAVIIDQAPLIGRAVT